MRLITFLILILCFSCFNPSVSQASGPFFTMKRTACYGTCPQYLISIYDNGKITYEGILFVDRIGCFSSFMVKEKIDSIKYFLNEMDFFSLQEEYISPMTDIPSVITEVNIDGKTHKVIDRLEGPKSLKKCYKLIDNMIESISTWAACTSLTTE